MHLNCSSKPSEQRSLDPDLSHDKDKNSPARADTDIAGVACAAAARRVTCFKTSGTRAAGATLGETGELRCQSRCAAAAARGRPKAAGAPAVRARRSVDRRATSAALGRILS